MSSFFCGITALVPLTCDSVHVCGCLRVDVHLNLCCQCKYISKEFVSAWSQEQVMHSKHPLLLLTKCYQDKLSSQTHTLASFKGVTKGNTSSSLQVINNLSMFITFHMDNIDNIDHPIRKDNGNGVELFFFLSSFFLWKKKYWDCNCTYTCIM